MSEDRLERALQEMKAEDVDAGALEAARARAWEKLTTHAGSAICAEFRQDFRAYLGKELGASRRILVEDHLSRCPGCRTRIAEMKGERTVIAMPVRSSSRWVRRGTLAAAAALVLAVVYVGRDTIDAMMAPGGPRATVVSADGGLYRLAVGSLEAGAAIGERESVRTGPGAHAVLRLADESTVEVNERTELFVSGAWSGQTIHLQRGDIIVKAAKQRRGSLRVLTRDSIASVKGTIFAVSAGMGGSVVSVVEGSVAVNQPGKELVLSPGEQAASIPALASSVAAGGFLESRFGVLPGAARVAREDRTRAGEFPCGDCGPPRPCSRIFPRSRCLRRGPEPGTHDHPGPGPRRGAVGPERDVRDLVEFRDGTDLETDCGPHPVGEPAARGRNRLLCQLRRNHEPVPMVMARGAAWQAGGARDRPERAVRRGGRVRVVFDFRRPDRRFRLADAPGVGHSRTWGRAPALRLRQPSRAAISAAWAG